MSDHDPITRPARLALSIPDSGSSGIIDVADLRADPPPLSLSPPEGSSPTARHAASRWPLVGVLSAAAASLTMVALATLARPAPTVVVQQPAAPLAPELAMHEAPQPEVRTAVEHEATRRRPARAKASEDDATKSSEPEPSTSKAKASRTKGSRSTSKRRAASKGSTNTKTKTPSSEPNQPSSIAVECVLDPSRCTASGTPKSGTGSSSRTSTKARPAKLDASQLKAALASTKANARRCGTQHGADPGTRVQVKLSIEGSTGRVVSATPQGDHASGSLGRCVAQALSQTQFPRFGSTRMGTLYSVRM